MALSLSVLVLALGFGYLLYTLYSVLFDPLKDVPGPFFARFTRFWELLRVHECAFEEVNIALHKRYGSIVRLAPGRYSLNEPTASRTLYGHGTKFEKSSFYFAFGSPFPEGSDLFNERSVAIHSGKRRRVAQLYSMSALLSYEQYVDRQNAVLCEKLRSISTSRSQIHVYKLMQAYAFDVIGEITVGESFGFMQKDYDDLGILHAIHDGSVYGARVGLLGNLHFYAGLLVRRLKIAIPFTAVLAFINKNIELRRTGQQTSDRADFLSKLLQLKQAEKIEDVDVITTLGANIAAGSDTTAISLSSIIRYLQLNPECLTRLRAEMDDRLVQSKLSNPVKYQEAIEMPYLQAVIKEAIRLHPATGQPLSRVVPAGGATVAGRYFPAGSVVGINPWVLHRNPDIYGPDAEQFRPERWLESGNVPHESNYLSFGAGARTCLGRNISLLEMSKVIPQIYREFELLPSEKQAYSKATNWFVKPNFEMKVCLRAGGTEE